MRVRLEGELGGRRGALDHAGEAGGGERRAPLRREDERRLRLLLALKLPERPQFVAKNGVRAGRALLSPADVQAGRFEVHLIPAQCL